MSTHRGENWAQSGGRSYDKSMGIDEEKGNAPAIQPDPTENAPLRLGDYGCQRSLNCVVVRHLLKEDQKKHNRGEMGLKS